MDMRWYNVSRVRMLLTAKACWAGCFQRPRIMPQQQVQKEKCGNGAKDDLSRACQGTESSCPCHPEAKKYSDCRICRIVSTQTENIPKKGAFSLKV